MNAKKKRKLSPTIHGKFHKNRWTRIQELGKDVQIGQKLPKEVEKRFQKLFGEEQKRNKNDVTKYKKFLVK